jgi:class 3 adenylate cyclase
MLAVRLPRFNRRVRERTLGNGFEMGIGLNSGLFIAGNVGSARRLEYTVYGDTVNTASRIEGMTKTTRQSVLIADATRQALLRPPSDLVHVGEFDVRGKQSSISLWTI